MARSLNARNLDKITKELLEKKLRRSAQGHWSDSDDAQARIRDISEALRSHADIYEIRRHAVVAIIAALQTYHRGYIADVMDKDSSARLRGSSLVGEKLALHEILKIIGTVEVSLSDVIAHAAPINSLEEMLTWLSTIIGEDYKSLVANAVSPFDRDDPDCEKKIVPDVEGLFCRISEAFKLRHILAHEAAFDIELNKEDVEEIVDSIKLWVSASDAILWQTVLKDEPFTQFQINDNACAKLSAAENELIGTAVRLRKLLSDDARDRFDQNQKIWLHNAMDLTDISYGSNEGTMWPAVRAAALQREIEFRVSQIEEWIDYIEIE